MDEERDYAVFTDEEGNEFELEIITYFDYNDNEYAILADLCECEDEECEEETGFYIMRVVETEDGEEFVQPDEADMDALTEAAEKILEEECCCDCDDCDCDDCDGECDCEGECNCGCHDNK